MRNIFFSLVVLQISCNGAAEHAASPTQGHVTELFEIGNTHVLAGTDDAPLLGISPPVVHRGRVYVPNPMGGRVFVFDTTGTLLQSVEAPGRGLGPLPMPYRVAIVSDTLVLLYDRQRAEVQVMTTRLETRRVIPAMMNGEQVFSQHRGSSDVKFTIQGPAPCGREGTCLMHRYDHTGGRLNSFAPLRGDDVLLYTWTSEIDAQGQTYLANVLGSRIDVYSSSGEHTSRINLDSPSMEPFRSESRTESTLGMSTILSELRQTEHTRIRTLHVLNDALYVQIERMNGDPEPTRYVIDIYDRNGHLVLYGIETEGILRSSGGDLYFVRHDRSGYGQIMIQTARMRHQPWLD